MSSGRTSASGPDCVKTRLRSTPTRGFTRRVPLSAVCTSSGDTYRNLGAGLAVDLETATQPDDEIEPVPEPDIAPLQWPEPPRPPVRRRVPPREDVGGAQPSEPAPPEVTIGMLSPGGEATAQSQQQARDLIASTERRIIALPPRVASSQRSEVRQARDFLDKSKKALNTGDADGAMNLANKARLLMDELERR